MYPPEKLYSYKKHKKLIYTISSVGTPAEEMELKLLFRAKMENP
jgi:hypothetical protein